MAAEVGHGAIAKIPPAIPARAGEVVFVEIPIGGRSDPEIPVEPGRHRHALFGRVGGVDDVLVRFGLFLRLPTPGATDPDVAFGDFADGAAFDQFDDAPVVLRGVDLCAHLGHQLGAPGGLLNDHAAFPHVAGQRFFAVNVLVCPQGWQDAKGVSMLRAGHDDGVDVFQFAQQIPEIGVAAGFRRLLQGRAEVVLIHVAEGDDVLLQIEHRRHMGASPAADADQGDAKLRIGRLRPRDGRKTEGAGRGERANAGLDESAPGSGREGGRLGRSGGIVGDVHDLDPTLIHREAGRGKRGVIAWR